MNNSRRHDIKLIINDLRQILSFDMAEDPDYVADELDVIAGDIDDVADSEQDSIDSMPENLQYSTRCEEMTANVDDLGYVSSDIYLMAQSIRENKYQDLNKKVEEAVETLLKIINR